MKTSSDNRKSDPLDLPFRELLSEAMQESGKTRDQIASELSKHVGRPITASMLNDYTARTKESYKFPAAWIAAVLEITGGEKLRGSLMSTGIRLRLELADCELIIQERLREIQREQRKKLRLAGALLPPEGRLDEVKGGGR